MAFLRDAHPDDEIRLHLWQAESRNKHRDKREVGGVFPPKESKSPSTIHLCLMAVVRCSEQGVTEGCDHLNLLGELGRYVEGQQ